MTQQNVDISSDISIELIFPVDILLFSAGEYFFGVFASQVKKVEYNSHEIAYTTINENQLRDFHINHNRCACSKSRLDIKFYDQYRNPYNYCVEVDAVEDIVCVEQKDIAPFPSTVEPFAVERGMWAVMPRNRKLYILLDFKKLICFLSENSRSFIRDKEDFPTNKQQINSSDKRQRYTLLNGQLTITRLI